MDYDRTAFPHRKAAAPIAPRPRRQDHDQRGAQRRWTARRCCGARRYGRLVVGVFTIRVVGLDCNRAIFGARSGSAAASPRAIPPARRAGTEDQAMTNESPRKFRIGQTVYYWPAKRGQDAPRGRYLIISLLPQREDGDFEYRIRNLDEQHERVAQEA
jgi:hypothetical protein